MIGDGEVDEFPAVMPEDDEDEEQECECGGDWEANVEVKTQRATACAVTR